MKLLSLLKPVGLFFGVVTWLDLLFITLLVNLHGFVNITIIDKVIMVLCAGIYFIAKAIVCVRITQTKLSVITNFSLLKKREKPYA